MRTRIVFICFVFFACARTAFAQADSAADKEKLAAESGLGTALILGEPMGVSLKLWISRVSALDAGVGWSLYRRTDRMMRRGAPYAYIEYLRHFFDEVKARTGKFVYFIGVGAESAYNYFDDEGLRDSCYFGVRLPFGMSYMFQDLPLDIFLELDPSIVFFFTGVTSDMGACVGLRYWLY